MCFFQYKRNLLKTLTRIADSLEELNSRNEKDINIQNLRLSSTDIFDKPTKKITTDTIVNQGYKKIQDYLNTKNIQVKNFPEQATNDDVFSSIANFMASNYDVLKDFILKIKQSLSNSETFSFSIKKYTQKEGALICNFCQNLHSVAFLENYHYKKSPQYLIYAKASANPKIYNFFTGHWLEIYSLNVVLRILNNLRQKLNTEIEFSYLINPQIILPNGDDFELDLIFSVNNEFYWIESKSGDYQQYINKYSAMAKKLNIRENNAIMLLTEINKIAAESLSSLFLMKVLSIDDFEQYLFSTIQNQIEIQKNPTV